MTTHELFILGSYAVFAAGLLAELVLLRRRKQRAVAMVAAYLDLDRHEATL